MEKVLIVMPRVSSFYKPLLRGFSELNYPHKFFDSRGGLAYTSLFLRRLMRRFPALRHIKKISRDALNRKLLREVAKYKPSVLFVVGGESILPETITAIRKQYILTLNWFPDLMTHWHVIRKQAPAYNHFFAIDVAIVDTLRAEGINNVSYSLLAAPFGPEHFPEIRQYPISFVGSYNPVIWPKREPFLNAIKDLGLNIWGPPQWQNTSLAPYYRGTAHGEDMLKICAQSKISLDIATDHLKANSVAPRVFEVMSSGAALFYYNIRDAIKNIFVEGSDYVAFSSGEELHEKISYYLSHEAELTAIAKSGYQKTQDRHTYPQRIKELINTAKNAGVQT